MLGEYCGREERGRSEQGHSMLPDTAVAKAPGASEGERSGPATAVRHHAACSDQPRPPPWLPHLLRRTHRDQGQRQGTPVHLGARTVSRPRAQVH